MRRKKGNGDFATNNRLRVFTFSPRVVLGILWALPLSLIGFLIALPVLLLQGRVMILMAIRARWWCAAGSAIGYWLDIRSA